MMNIFYMGKQQKMKPMLLISSMVKHYLFRNCTNSWWAVQQVGLKKVPNLGGGLNGSREFLC